jgi:hypothetical protein
MDIIIKTKKQIFKYDIYVLFQSNKKLKCNRWEHKKDFESLEEAFEQLEYIREHYDNEEEMLYKYKIVKETVVTTHSKVCPKEVMLLRIKHGV